MEVVVAVPPPPSTMDFNFDSNCSSPYITAPSSPQRFGNMFFSAPTSPTRTVNNSSLFLFNPRHSSASTSPAPQPHNTTNDPNEDYDFEFDFSGHLERPSLSADELFHGGRIRPLKPPSPVSTSNRASSNRREKRVVEEATGGGTRKRVEEAAPPPQQSPQEQHKLGRERASSFSIPSTSSSSAHKGSRSSVCVSDDVSSQRGNTKTSETASTIYSSFLSSISFTKGYRKWSLKDFLLFRSASEGRATNKDPLRKYAALSKTTADVYVRNISSRSTESSGSGSSRRRGPVSAHELHYTVNRAASEELKKKTLLPYKQGLLGCLGFNPGMHHISRRVGSLERS